VHSASIGSNRWISADPAGVSPTTISRPSVGWLFVETSRRVRSLCTTSRIFAGSIATSRPNKFCDTAPRSCSRDRTANCGAVRSYALIESTQLALAR
jgi:hypothetical protein